MVKLSELEKERIRQEIWGKKKILSDGSVFYSKGKKDQTLLAGAKEDIEECGRTMRASKPDEIPANMEVDVQRLSELHNKNLWEKTQEDVKEELGMVTNQLQSLIYGIEVTEDIILEATKNWNSFRDEKRFLERAYKGLKYYVGLTPEQFKKEQQTMLNQK